MELTPKGLKNALKVLIESGESVFIWGPPGIGKSAIVRQVADELGFEHFRDIRLSQKDPTDVGVVGFPHPEKGIIELPPSFFPKERKGGDRLMLFFDEMNLAPPLVQAAAYEIVLDRRIGQFRLGEKDAVVAAGNEDTHGAHTHRMATPLANRFTHLWVRPDVDDFIDYAVSVGIRADVVGYLKVQPQHLFSFNPKSTEKAYPTPRSWERLGRILDRAEKMELADEELMALVGGTVGEGVAVSFLAFRNKFKALPSAREILEGKSKLDVQKVDYGLLHAVALALVQTMADLHKKVGNKKAEWDRYCTNFVDFITKLDPELSFFAMKAAFGKFPVGPRMAGWKSFEKHVRMLMRLDDKDISDLLKG